jgi:hypothetical protein
MTARRSILLVIDASVMQAAGETAHPVSSTCRDALLAILEICHKVATTEKIRDEWKEHMSRFSRKWLHSMAAHRKYPHDVNPDKIVLDTTGLPDEDCAAIEKDLHLIEAAFSADRIIVTRDDALRAALAKTRKGVHVVKSIRWINPINEGGLLKSL